MSTTGRTIGRALTLVLAACAAAAQPAVARAGVVKVSDATGDVVERALDFEQGAPRRVVAGDTYYLYLQLEGAATFIGAKVFFR